ncbi:hypothetical protein [uncultured virus]|uniref:SET domain-containing protein n=1 Tax=uncultured virus TaxID=340016 RepID=A0A218ML49_9VIRU|nr:hypothetical protein [uncultured virus]
MEKIALLPGGFKPPHAGHYNMAKWLISNTDADTVIVKVGIKIRDGINREVALKLWDLYRSTDPDPISKKIAILASNSNSPVQDVYDFVEKEAPEGSKIYLGMGEKDVNDKRFNNIGKFAEPKGINFEIKLVPPQTGGISGTEMRNFVKIKDKDNFLKYIPDHLSKSNKDKAWGIVTGLEEDLYNPEDKVLDYMRGSEWKAGMPDGPKDDKTSPVIKYQRGGMYNAATGQGGAGTMYENKYYLNNSNIQGQGAFAQENYPEGTVIDKLHDILGQGQYNFYELGKMYNHSETPNCKNIMKNNTRYLVTIQPVRQGEELTADYRLQPDLEQPEHFLNELDISEETINECWKGYVKKGMKKKGNKMVPNCVPRNEGMSERDLSDKEEKIAQDLPDKEFKKRYGKDWKSVKIATATKMAKNEGDTYEKMAAKGKKKGNLKQGTVRKRLKIKDGEKIPLSKITKAISKIKKMKNPSEKNKKYLKALNLAKTLKTTTHKEDISEADPKKGTGKKPKGSGRRLYTDENPKDTVKVKFSTRQDIVDTLNKASFKSKSHKRQSQVINLIHQRVRAALNRAKDSDVKKRLRTAFDYIKKRKEASKKKTQRMKNENTFSKGWWSNIINEILLTEGGAAGHMAHPFDLPNVKSGRDLKNIFMVAATSLNTNPGSVKIDGVNASIRLITLDGVKQFVMDRGSKKELDIKGITKDDLLSRFGDGHGMVKIGGEVLDMFNTALPQIENDLKALGAWEDPNILFNMEYVSGKTNVQDYGSNFIAIHGLNKIESKEVQGKRKMLTKRTSTEISYNKSALQSMLDNLSPTAKKQGFKVYGSVPTEMKKKPNFNSALSQNYSVESTEEVKTQPLSKWLDEVSAIPKDEFIFITRDNTSKKVGAVSKQVYQLILNGENIDDLFNENDKKKAIDGFVTYLATEKLGDEILKVLDSPMGSVEDHEGVVIRDEKIASVPFKITGKFILGGLISDF